jgi:hypothetical protein
MGGSLHGATRLSLALLLGHSAPFLQAAAQEVQGQPYSEQDAGGTRPFKNCRDPREKVGVISGSGDISFLLRDNGEPDTSSIAILAATAVSAPGLRSALVRLMERCRFEPGRIDGKRVAVQLFRRVTLDSTRLTFGLMPSDAQRATLLSAVAIAVGQEYDVNHPAVEERPRPCKFRENEVVSPDLRPVDARNEQQFRENAARIMAENSGIVRILYVIGTDGRVDPATYEVLSSTNLRLLPRAKQIVLGCRYEPARASGVPVRVRVIWTITFGNPNPSSSLQ